MTARRPLLLCVLFLGSVCILGNPNPAAGQPPPFPPAGGQFSPGEPLTPEQVRGVLARIGGLPPEQDPFNQMIKQHIEGKGLKIDPKDLQNAIDRVRNDKRLMDQLQKMAREQNATGKSANFAEMEKALNNLPLKNVMKPNPPQGHFPGAPPEKLQPGPQGPFPSKRQPVGPNGPDQPKPAELPLPSKGTGRPQDAPAKGAPQQGNGSLNAITIPSGNRGNPFSGEFTHPRQAHQQRAMETAAALWERNIGPLNETPTVKRLLFDLVVGTEGMTDSQGNNIWDALSKETGDGGSFGDWFDKGGLGGDWKMPSFEMGSTSFGRWWSGSNREPSGGDWSLGGSSSGRGWSSGTGGFGFGGLEGSWLPVVLLAAVLLGVLVWWRFWYLRDPVKSGWEPPEGLGAWPLDPRHITTREDLVRAFEYLSVLICGMEARTWTHGTIGQALAQLATTHGETALLLARLYELARYAPLDEPLTRDELGEGRDIVCRLAGVSSA